MEVFKYLENSYSDRLEVNYLSVNSLGAIDMSAFEKLLTINTGFISIMHSNNETGVLQPIKEMVKLGKKVNSEIIFHTDAAQSLGKTYIDVNDLQVDLLSICPHKFYGPKGIGALYIRQGIEAKLEKLIHGANHEKNLRAGTENVLEIVGLGKASELVTNDLEARIKHFQTTRNIIYKKLVDNFGDYVKLHGPPIDFNVINKENRLSNTLFISFPGIEANLIIDMLSDKIACSAGAACHSDDVKISHVLEAMKISSTIAMGTLRLSTGLKLSIEDAEKAGDIITETAKKILAEKTKQNPIKEISYDFDENIKLTKTTHGLGCGCKLSATLLSNILKDLPVQKIIENNPNILVGTETADDCCVYKLTPDIALIKTLDFFTPICDLPEDYGAISCANALSDIYAMGGKPLLALNIVCFPVGTMAPSILKRILLGAQQKAEEAGVAILGGHSIEDTEPKFGLSVTGIANPGYIWRNSSMNKGDFIIITKKLGVGTLMTGLKRQIIQEDDEENKLAIESMKFLNKYHCESLMELENNELSVVTACTDITGFGLLGHLKEGLKPEKKSASIYYDSVPFFAKAKSLVEMGVVPGGTLNNLNFVKDYCLYDEKLTGDEKNMINDPQTSGGLMIFVSSDNLKKVIRKFKEKKLDYYVIGRVEMENQGKINVKKGKLNYEN